MKNQYIKSNSNRHTTNELTNKNQLESRLKVIELLKEQIYPTGKFFQNKIFSFYLFSLIM
jgi:hypothetical protein